MDADYRFKISSGPPSLDSDSNDGADVVEEAVLSVLSMPPSNQEDSGSCAGPDAIESLTTVAKANGTSCSTFPAFQLGKSGQEDVSLPSEVGCSQAGNSATVPDDFDDFGDFADFNSAPPQAWVTPSDVEICQPANAAAMETEEQVTKLEHGVLDRAEPSTKEAVLLNENGAEETNKIDMKLGVQAKAEVMLRKEAEAKLEKEAEVKPEAEPEEKAHAEPEEKAQAEPEEKAQAEGAERVQAEPEEKAQAEPEEKPQAEPEEKPEAEPEEKPQAEPEEKPQAESEGKPQAEPEGKPQAEGAEKVQAEPEEKPQAEPEEKAQAEGAEKAQAEPEEKAQAEGAEKMQAEAAEPEEKAQAEPEEKVQAEGAEKMQAEAAEPEEKVQAEAAEPEEKSQAELEEKAETKREVRVEENLKYKSELQRKDEAEVEFEDVAKSEAELVKAEPSGKTETTTAQNVMQECVNKERESGHSQPEVAPETEVEAATEDFGDFRADFQADFATFESTTEKGASSLEGAEIENDWAEFSDVASADKAKAADNGESNADDDEFGDFDYFQGADSTSFEAPPPLPQPLVTPERRFHRLCADLRSGLDRLLGDALADGSEVDDDGHDDPAIDPARLEQLLRAESAEQLEDVKSIVTQAASSHPTTTNVWSNLMDLENSPAVKYQWAQSAFYEESLKALNIDVRNVLNSRKHAYPIFAGQLGLLEPTPVASSATADAADNGEASTAPATGELNETTEAGAAAQAASSVDPGLKFDWSSSGLTNPLDISALMLDLDNIGSGRPSTSGRSRNYAELEAEFLDSSGGGGGGSSNGGIGSAEKTLSSLISASAATAPAPASALSERARQFLKRLPDLSYMRAKVLMFPMHQSNSESSLPITDDSP